MIEKFLLSMFHSKFTLSRSLFVRLKRNDVNQAPLLQTCPSSLGHDGASDSHRHPRSCRSFIRHREVLPTIFATLHCHIRGFPSSTSLKSCSVCLAFSRSIALALLARQHASKRTTSNLRV